MWRLRNRNLEPEYGKIAAHSGAAQRLLFHRSHVCRQQSMVFVAICRR
jgi:hypothetical protein